MVDGIERSPNTVRHVRATWRCSGRFWMSAAWSGIGWRCGADAPLAVLDVGLYASDRGGSAAGASRARGAGSGGGPAGMTARELRSIEGGARRAAGRGCGRRIGGRCGSCRTPTFRAPVWVGPRKRPGRGARRARGSRHCGCFGGAVGGRAGRCAGWRDDPPWARESVSRVRPARWSGLILTLEPTRPTARSALRGAPCLRCGIREARVWWWSGGYFVSAS